MKSLIRPVLIITAGTLAIFSFAITAQAQSANVKVPFSPGKSCQVLMPKEKLICKSCKNIAKPLKSSSNPNDKCCETVFVGYTPVSPKNGDCTPPQVGNFLAKLYKGTKR